MSLSSHVRPAPAFRSRKVAVMAAVALAMAIRGFATPTLTISVPSSVETGRSYDASATGSDSDGNIISILLTKDGTPLAYDDIYHGGQPTGFTVHNPTSDTGPTSIHYEASMNVEGLADPVTADTWVQVNPKPTVTWSSYPTAYTVVVGASYYIQAEGHDTTGRLSAVYINENGQPFAYVPVSGTTGYSGRSTIAPSAPCTIVYEAWCMNSALASSDHITVTVNVVSGPSASIALSPNPVHIRQNYSLSGGGAAPPNYLNRVEVYREAVLTQTFYSSAGGPVTFSTPTINRSELTYTSEVWQAIAYDSLNLGNANSAQVTVASINSFPVSDSLSVTNSGGTPVSSATVGATLTIHATGHDVDTNIIQLQLASRWRADSTQPWSGWTTMNQDYTNGVGSVNATPSFTLTATGEYQIQSDLIDPYGDSGTRSVIVASTPGGGGGGGGGTPTNPPSAPTGVAATNITASGFTIAWNSVATATAYYLDVATDSGFSNIVPAYNNVNANAATSFPVVGLNPGVTYYYRVRAYNTAGLSANSTGTPTATLAIGLRVHRPTPF